MDIIENKDFLTESDELLVKGFFEENKIDIADNGFSERVMRCLPSPSVRLNRIWTAVCTLLGAVWLFSVLSDVTLKNVKGGLLYLGKNIAEGLWSRIVSIEVSQHSLLMAGVAILTLSVIVAYNIFESKRLL